jgi:AcrR family transcriptional regulator
VRADAQRNRRRLLDAARAEFAEHGLDAGVDAVARRAGVGMGTLYRHFPTKGALVEAVIRDRADDLVAALRDTDSFADAATVLVCRFVEDRGVFDAVAQEPEAVPALLAIRDEVLRAWTPLVHDAQRRGELRDDVTPAEALQFLARISRPPRLRPIEAVPWRRLLELALAGLTPRAGVPDQEEV